MEPLEEGEHDQSTGTMPPVGTVDPNGLQTAAMVSAGGGAVLISQGADGTVADLLGISPATEVLTAGFSMATLGQLSVFTAGLLLVGLSVVLNAASLAIRWQYWFSWRRAAKKDKKPQRDQ